MGGLLQPINVEMLQPTRATPNTFASFPSPKPHPSEAIITMAGNSSDLPDFDVMRDSFDKLATETAKIQNVAGIQANTTILATLQRIEQRQIASETRAKAS
jgi:hypothetical protein